MANKILTWTGRILAIIQLVFYTIKAIGGLPDMMQFILLFLPALTIAIVLKFAWINEEKGAYLFYIIGGIMLIFYGAYKSFNEFFTVVMPFIIIGTAFILNVKLMGSRSGSKK